MATQITLGGMPVMDAVAARRSLAELGYLPPPHFDRANSLLNPLGEQPARGWFLLLRQHLNRLNVNALQRLILQDQFGNQINVPNLVIAREPTCITPSGNTSDPNACFLVEVADARYRCHNPYYSIPINSQYNVRAPGWGGLYYEGSVNVGVPWTWTAMLGDIWGNLSAQLGSYPGLPSGVSPDGQPERFRFLGVSAWQALNQVLGKLGIAVAWQATNGQYAIIALGATDSTTAGILQKAAARLIFDRQFQAVVRGRVPAGVRVHFHRVQEHYGSEPSTEQDVTQFITSNVYTVNVAGPTAQTNGAEPGTFHPLWDDLPALYDPSGVLLNLAALEIRAQNRANAYYASIQGAGGGRWQQIYSGLVNVSPGSTIRGVSWRQDLSALGDPGGDAGGLITEVVRWPSTALRVADNGQFEEALADSTALHPPDLRVKEPTWPDLLQMVAVGTLQPNGFYNAMMQRWNADVGAWQDYEPIWVLDANG